MNIPSLSDHDLAVEIRKTQGVRVVARHFGDATWYQIEAPPDLGYFSGDEFHSEEVAYSTFEPPSLEESMKMLDELPFTYQIQLVNDLHVGISLTSAALLRAIHEAWLHFKQDDKEHTNG